MAIKRMYKKPNVDWPIHTRDPETGAIRYDRSKLNVSPNYKRRRQRRRAAAIKRMDAAGFFNRILGGLR